MLPRLVAVIAMLLVAVVAGSALDPGSPDRAAALQATPAETDCPTTTAEENEALAQSYVDALFSDVDAFGELLTPAYVHHRGFGSGELRGAEEFMATVRQTQDAFAAADTTVEQILSDDALVALTLTTQLTHNGEYAGAAATGRSGTWEQMHIFRVECGRIAEAWSVADALGLFQQLGIVTDDELATAATPTP